MSTEYKCQQARGVPSEADITRMAVEAGVQDGRGAWLFRRSLLRDCGRGVPVPEARSRALDALAGRALPSGGGRRPSPSGGGMPKQVASLPSGFRKPPSDTPSDLNPSSDASSD